MKFFTGLTFVLLAITICFSQTTRRYQFPKGTSLGNYYPNIIMVRVKESSNESTRVNLKSISDITKETGINKFNSLIKTSSLANARQKKHPLSNIYKLEINNGGDLLLSINDLLEYDEIIYAEPYFKYEPLYVPNDPQAQPGTGAQTFLEVIKAYDAWDIEKGDASIIIGILDTGVQLDHEDLGGNIYLNLDDPVNGVDDDEDGYIDNYYGWDFADNDSDVTADQNQHGNLVAGISSAETDNGIALAGIGFNSKFMPIKIFPSDGGFAVNEYEAMIYAADRGCKVINLSWGAAGAFCQFGQDVINYVALEKDVVIVAAAGNTHENLDFYPASFNNVMSVGGTNNLDQITFSSYSVHIDVAAPGENIFTAKAGNSYGSDTGTSLSSPMVAGTAALVRARFPELNALQVIEKIRVTSDDIYQIPGNTPFTGFLGKGRLNVAQALTDNISPSIRMVDLNIKNKIGNHVFYGDSVNLSATFINYLNPTNNARVILSTTSGFATVIDSEYQLGKMETLDSIDNINNPFEIFIHQDTPPETKLVFRLDYEDDFYNDFQYFEIVTSPPCLIVDNNHLALTVSSNGDLGHCQNPNNQGVGMLVDGKKVMDNIGLMIGNSDDNLANNVVNKFTLNNHDQGFIKRTYIKYFNNSEAELDARSVFDINADSVLDLPLRIEQKVLTGVESEPFIILEYRIINLAIQDIDSLWGGLFLDWNLSDLLANKAGWSASELLGYVHNEDNSLYTGAALLSNFEPVYNAYDKANLNGNISDLPNGFTKSKKFDGLYGGIDKTAAGTEGIGNDVAHLVGAKLNALAPNEAIKLTFALVSGDNLADLKVNLDLAKSFYANYLTKPPILSIAEVCQGESATINPPGQEYDFYNDVALSNLISSGSSFETPPVSEEIIFYAVNKDSTYRGDVYRVIARPNLISADFLISQDTVFIDETGNNLVIFTDNSINASQWNWNFGNGFFSSSSQPSIRYNDPGSYIVGLDISSNAGCLASTSKTITVIQRSEIPQLAPISICTGDSYVINPGNLSQFRLYSSLSQSVPDFEGQEIEIGPFFSDSIIYLTGFDLPFESNPLEVSITINDLEAEFTSEIDTTDTSIKYLLKLTNQTNAISFSWNINGDTIINGISPVNFDYTDLNDFQVSLTVTNQEGCTNTLTKSITPSVSNAPTVSDLNVCPGEDNISITPGNGSIFYFYDDLALTNLIHKGGSLSLSGTANSKSIYVTGIDSLWESPPEEVMILVSPITADFTIDPDILNLGTGDREVNFTDQSIDATEWHWDFGNGISSTSQNPSGDFTTLGTYDITLSVKNDLGCIESKTKILTVVNVTDLDENELSNSLTIYPNPAKDFITLQLEEQFKDELEVLIHDLSGKLHINQRFKIINETISIDTGILPSGVYIMSIRSGIKSFYSKIIISNN